MQQLARFRQEREESIADYIIRASRLVLQAHQNLQPKEQEELLISHFITGLTNYKLAQHMMTVSPPTAADAERIATCSEVLQEFKITKRAAGALIARRAETGPCELEEGKSEVDDAECKADDEEASECLAAAGDPSTRPTIGLTGATGAMSGNSREPLRCFGCNRLCHLKAQCPQNRPGATRRSPTAPCDVSQGPHIFTPMLTGPSTNTAQEC